MRTVMTACVFVFLTAFVSAGNNWPEFRGPNGDGKSDAIGLPVKFSETEHVKWKTKIHGRGWSSPVVWGNQIWMQTATEEGHDLFAVCVNFRTGKIVHDIKVFHVDEPRFRHALNSYASPTPPIEEGRIYVHFGSYGTACLDTKTGKTLWERRDLLCDHFRASGSSPVIYKDLLIVSYDGVDYQYVVAFNKQTGKTVWKTDRNIDYGTDNGDRKKAYSTGSVISYKGRVQLISPSAVETISYNPLTGKEFWRVKHGGMNAASRPVFGQGLVYITAGDGPSRLVAVRPDGNGDVTQTHVSWNTGDTVSRRPSQLLVGDLLFMISDNGIASCWEAKTGEVIWQNRLPDRNYWASPVYTDGKIYFFSKEGSIPVIEAGRKFKLLANNKLDDGFNASPAIVGKSMILRTFTHLYRFEK
jgi:outer membrane protein assembly factor BamB